MDPRLREAGVKKEPLDGKDFWIFVSRRHTFSTDSVLLADFAAPKPREKYLDLCSGCGIVPFLLLRDGLQQAVGVEIEEEAVLLARQSAETLHLDDRATFLCSDLSDLSGKVEFGRFTLITCNPPYQPVGRGLASRESSDRAARHETRCDLSGIFRQVFRLLNTSGRFCLCIRPDRLSETLCRLHEAGLEPKRLRLCSHRRGKEPFLALIEARKCGGTGMRIADTLYLNENGDDSEEYHRIYKHFFDGGSLLHLSKTTQAEK